MFVTRWMILLAVAASTTACGDSSTSVDPDGGSDPDARRDVDAPQNQCTATGLSTTESPFVLPALIKPLHTIGGSDGSAGCTAYQNWNTIDLTGDGALDLVLTGHCTDTTVGVGRWLVYAGTASGFAASASDFSLPALIKPLHAIAGSDGSAGCTAYQNWSTFDLTGDGKLDLVLTGDCNDTTVGVGRWLVYPGTASGFAATASVFSLPTLTKPLHTIAGSDGSAGCTAYQNWSTLDVIGDDALDLVLTGHCSDATVGVGRWLVYAGTASGFAATASDFSLPALVKPLHAMAGSDGSAGCTAYQNWSTLDVTGDGALDLVLTGHCSDTTVGVGAWLVYSGTATGFAATSSMFSLPALVKPLHTIAGSDGSTGCTAYQNWSTFDLTGDGALDLVLTGHCSDATVGVGNWLVYPGASSGFVATGSMFSLPALTKPLHTVGGSDGSTGCTAYQNWSTVDLTDDGTLDLVLTGHCSDATVGIERWSVYAGICEP